MLFGILYSLLPSSFPIPNTGRFLAKTKAFNMILKALLDLKIGNDIVFIPRIFVRGK